MQYSEVFQRRLQDAAMLAVAEGITREEAFSIVLIVQPGQEPRFGADHRRMPARVEQTLYPRG